MIVPVLTKCSIALTNSPSEIAPSAHQPAVFFTQSGTCWEFDVVEDVVVYEGRKLGSRSSDMDSAVVADRGVAVGCEANVVYLVVLEPCVRRAVV